VPRLGNAASFNFNAAWGSLTALEGWIEKGANPSNRIVTDTAGVPGRTRPLRDYPKWPTYSGSSNVNLAASFVCAN
jgi:feruloyl esterase